MNEIDQIRKDMADIRLSLHKDIAGVVQDAETILDWRSYIRNAPWISMAAAFAVGYLIVPRRSRPETPLAAPEPSRGVFNLAGVAAPTRPPAPPRKRFTAWGLLGTVASMAAPVAIRAAQSYAVARLEELLAGGNAPPMPGGPAAGPGTGRPAGGAPPWAAGAGAGAGGNRPA